MFFVFPAVNQRSLKGIVKLYIMSESGITSWNKLKYVLVQEFGEKISTADLHKALTQRKMRSDEDVIEYFLLMKELASKGAIDESSLIQNVIEGIQDTSLNKIMLYGTKNIKEFKKRLKHYAAYKLEAHADKMTRTRTVFQERSTSKTNNRRIAEPTRQRCFNCGGKGHMSRNCESRSQGLKCFACNRYGHKASECRERNREDDKKPMNNISTPKLTNMCREVKVNHIMVTALIDTGVRSI